MVDQPITRLDVTDFGPFASADLTFSPQINVFVGTNNTGKSMLLKLLYAMTAVASEKSNPAGRGSGADSWPGDLPGKLRGVFNSGSISSLTTHGKRPTRLNLTLGDGSDLAYEFSDDEMPGDRNVFLDVGFRRPRGFPVFIPAHEILSVARGLRSLFATYEVPFDETWNDLATLLYRPRLKDRSDTEIEDFIGDIVGGRFEVRDERFALRRDTEGDSGVQFEAPLVSEGHRKLGMIQVLLANGVLKDQGYLFWDEPEANLNPASIRLLAPLIAGLARRGVQVFLATHSLFLLRELQMLDEDEAADIRYFGLDRANDDPVTVTQADDLDDLPVITALDAELEQSTRYLHR
ncbi:ATP/GTP-binding protein [Actinomyces sp.]|uniref:AAA family ATPase n=1 Tax=Actinomyces sp. TaxID=29317 RepID=UPI0026DC6611|nr:ATP-binding protein [Actinomyces sp.]MDO4900090.1 AAA family ATPase [Actinomyces sp.]